VADRIAVRAFVRNNALLSAAINAVFSAAFFFLVFGIPGRSLALGAPDGLALDFVPQAAAVGLMSAIVPVLVTRRELAGLVGAPPAAVGAILFAGVLRALVCLLLGAALATATGLLAVASMGGWTAFACKIAFGGGLGAVVTTNALRARLRAA